MIRTASPLVLVIGLALPVTAQTALVEEGDAIAGVGNVTAIWTLAVNDAGDWLVEVDTDNANTDIDFALLQNGSLLLQEGQALPAPAGATLDSFDAITLNNAGQSGWNFFLDGTTGTSDDSGIYMGTQLLIQEGDLSTASGFSAGTAYIGFFETKIDDTGRILVMASVDDPGIASTVDRALVVLTDDGSDALVETLFAAEGDLLPGQVETVADFETGPHNFALNDLGDVMFIADLNGNTATDHAVYVNDDLKAQEGSASPVGGRNWSVLSGAEVDLNDACEWVISGSLDGAAATNLLIEKNGAKFRQEGDSLAAISPFLLTSFGSGPVLIANSSEVLWYGDWDDPDTDVDTGLFVDDTLLVQEGVTTVGGVVIDTLRGIQDGYAISPNGRYVVFEAVLVDGTEGAYMIDRGIVAHQELRNGTGINPVCLKATTTPRLGGVWRVEIDSSAHPGADLVLFEARDFPLAPQLGPAGELLIKLSPPSRLSRVVGATGGVEVLTFNVPNNAAFIGRTVATQAMLFGPTSVLCNALDSTAGN